MISTSYFVGLDLGQAQDPSAFAVIERTSELEVPLGELPWDAGPPVLVSESFDVRYLERPKLGTSYLSICDRAGELTDSLAARGLVELVVDATGVGLAVLEMLRPRVVCPLHEVTITSGLQVTGGEADPWVVVVGGCEIQAGGPRFTWHVPKRDLVACVTAELGSDRLRIAAALPEAELLLGELRKFRMKISQAGRDTYSAWREADHDDLVLGVALALWRARKRPPAAAPPANGTRPLLSF